MTAAAAQPDGLPLRCPSCRSRDVHTFRPSQARRPGYHECMRCTWRFYTVGDVAVRDPAVLPVAEQFAEFAAEHVERATARVAQGAADYGDRSFDLRADRLADEVLEELADVNGWSFILAARIQRIRPALGAMERLHAFVDAVRAAVPVGDSLQPLTSHDDHVIAVRRVQAALLELDEVTP